MFSTTGRTSDETSLSFVCDENFGSGTLTESTQVRPSRASSPVSVTFSCLAMPLSSAYLLTWRVSAARKPCEMGAAIALRDVVGEAQHGLVIAVGPFQRAFDGDAVLLADHGDRRRRAARFLARSR